MDARFHIFSAQDEDKVASPTSGRLYTMKVLILILMEVSASQSQSGHEDMKEKSHSAATRDRPRSHLVHIIRQVHPHNINNMKR